MKVNKTISIDEETAKRLAKEQNASELIEKLLIEHFDREDMKNMSKEQAAFELEWLNKSIALAEEADKIRRANKWILR